jgi:hypothetical protein
MSKKDLASLTELLSQEESAELLAKAVVVILNKDWSELDQLQSNELDRKRRLTQEILDLPASSDPLPPDAFNEVDPITSFDDPIRGGRDAIILKARPLLHRLVTSWINADYKWEQWCERATFERFLKKRSIHFYHDRRDGRLLHFFDLSNPSSPGAHARWLFMLVVQSPYCRRIGYCLSCRKFCVKRVRSNFFCNDTCGRRHSSKIAKSERRGETRKKKLALVRLAAEKIRIKNFAPKARDETAKYTEAQWRNDVQRHASKLRGGEDISKKFVTQVSNSNEVAKPKFKERVSRRRTSKRSTLHSD